MQFPLPLPPPPWVKQIPPLRPPWPGDASPPGATFCSQAFVWGRGRDPPGFPQGPPCGWGPELPGVLSLRQEPPPGPFCLSPLCPLLVSHHHQPSGLYMGTPTPGTPRW